jgi:endoglucanase
VRKESLDFLRALIEAPSPSGFEQPAQRVVRERAKAFADEVQTDVHGNVMAIRNPQGSPRVMLAGHCDQIGLMVGHISDDGYIYTSAIGGMDPNVALAQRFVIHGPQGPVPAVVGRKAVHLLSPEDRKKGIEKIEDLFLDIGVPKKSEAEKLVSIGDAITFAAGFERLQGDFAVAAGFDDKMGTFIIMEALRLLKDREIPCAVYAVSTVQEEIGLRGATTSAFGIDPKVGIAVDVTHATDYPGASKTQGGDLRLGAGPILDRGPNINPKVFDLFVSTAKKLKIKYQVAAAPRGTGTDANVMQTTRAGVATGLISVANRYMHSPVEIIHLKDLEQTAKLIAEAVAKIDDKMDFIPL